MYHQSQSMDDLFKSKLEQPPQSASRALVEIKKFSNYSMYKLPATPTQNDPSSKYRQFDQELRQKHLDSLEKMCISVRDEIVIEAEIRIREIVSAKNKLLDELDCFVKNKTEELDMHMIQRLRKMSQSIKRGLDVVSELDDLSCDSFLNDQKLEFIPLKSAISLGELKLRSTKRLIVYDPKLFRLVNLADVFKLDSFNDLDVLSVEYENGNYFTIYTDFNSESKMLYWNCLTRDVTMFSSPKTISFITFMLKNDHIVLNYIHEPTQNYYLRVYQVDVKDRNKLKNKSLLNSHDECYENLFLIGIDHSFIYCSSNNGLYVFDFECKLIKSFGQLTKSNEAFYFGNNIKQIDTHDNRYYWLNDSSLNITDMNNGRLLNSIATKGDKFVFDSNQKLVVFSSLEKRLIYTDADGKIEKIFTLVDFPSLCTFFLDKNDIISFLPTSKCELYISIDNSIYNN